MVYDENTANDLVKERVAEEVHLMYRDEMIDYLNKHLSIEELRDAVYKLKLENLPEPDYDMVGAWDEDSNPENEDE